MDHLKGEGIEKSITEPIIGEPNELKGKEKAGEEHQQSPRRLSSFRGSDASDSSQNHLMVTSLYAGDDGHERKSSISFDKIKQISLTYSLQSEDSDQQSNLNLVGSPYEAANNYIVGDPNRNERRESSESLNCLSPIHGETTSSSSANEARKVSVIDLRALKANDRQQQLQQQSLQDCAQYNGSKISRPQITSNIGSKENISPTAYLSARQKSSNGQNSYHVDSYRNQVTTQDFNNARNSRFSLTNPFVYDQINYNNRTSDGPEYVQCYSEEQFNFQNEDPCKEDQLDGVVKRGRSIETSRENVCLIDNNVLLMEDYNRPLKQEPIAINKNRQNNPNYIYPINRLATNNRIIADRVRNSRRYINTVEPTPTSLDLHLKQNDNTISLIVYNERDHNIVINNDQEPMPGDPYSMSAYYTRDATPITLKKSRNYSCAQDIGPEVDYDSEEELVNEADEPIRLVNNSTASFRDENTSGLDSGSDASRRGLLEDRQTIHSDINRDGILFQNYLNPENSNYGYKTLTQPRRFKESAIASSIGNTLNHINDGQSHLVWDNRRRHQPVPNQEFQVLEGSKLVSNNQAFRTDKTEDVSSVEPEFERQKVSHTGTPQIGISLIGSAKPEPTRSGQNFMDNLEVVNGMSGSNTAPTDYSLADTRELRRNDNRGENLCRRSLNDVRASPVYYWLNDLNNQKSPYVANYSSSESSPRDRIINENQVKLRTCNSALDDYSWTNLPKSPFHPDSSQKSSRRSKIINQSSAYDHYNAQESREITYRSQGMRGSPRKLNRAKLGQYNGQQYMEERNRIDIVISTPQRYAKTLRKPNYFSQPQNSYIKSMSRNDAKQSLQYSYESLDNNRNRIISQEYPKPNHFGPETGNNIPSSYNPMQHTREQQSFWNNYTGSSHEHERMDSVIERRTINDSDEIRTKPNGRELRKNVREKPNETASSIPLNDECATGIQVANIIKGNKSETSSMGSEKVKKDSVHPEKMQIQDNSNIDIQKLKEFNLPVADKYKIGEESRSIDSDHKEDRTVHDGNATNNCNVAIKTPMNSVQKTGCPLFSSM